MANKAKLITLAQKAMSRSQWDKAVSLLEKVLVEDPADVRTMLKLGDVLAKKGERDRATEVYQQVAEAHAEQGFFLKAVAVYKQILKLDGTNGDAALRIAELHEQLGLSQDAMVHYQLALPILEEAGEHDRCIGVLERILELDGENVAARIKLAETLSRSENRAGAVEHFAAAAAVLKQHARIEDYVKVAERLIFHDSSRLDVVKDLAKLYLGRGDTKRGLAKLQICFRESPRDVETLTLLAKAFSDLGQVQKTVYVYRELARVHEEEGRGSEARDIHRLILQHHPDDPEALRALGLSDYVPEGSASSFDAAEPFPTSSGPDASMTGALPLNASRDLDSPTLEPAVEFPFSSGPAYPDPVLAPRERAPSRAGSNTGPISDGGFSEGRTVMADEPPPRLPDAMPPPLAPSAAPRPTASPTTSDLILVEEALPSEASEGESEEVSRIVREAEVYIRYNLPGKAIEHLEQAFAANPESILVYRRLHDVYRSMNDDGRAAEALANVMQLLSRAGDTLGAERARDELSSLAPGHPALRGARPRSADELMSEGAAEPGGDIPDLIDLEHFDDIDIDTGEVAPNGAPMTAGRGMGAWWDAAAGLSAPAGAREEPLPIEEPVSDAMVLGAEAMDESAAESAAALPAPPPPPGVAGAGWGPLSGDAGGEDDDLDLEDVVASFEARPSMPHEDTPVAFDAEVPLASAPYDVETPLAPAPYDVETPAAPELAAFDVETPPAPELAPDAGIEDEVAEVRFFIEAELLDEAREALDVLLNSQGPIPILVGLEAELGRAEAASGEASTPDEPAPDLGRPDPAEALSNADEPLSSPSDDVILLEDEVSGQVPVAGALGPISSIGPASWNADEALSFLGATDDVAPSEEVNPSAEAYDQGMAFMQIGQYVEAAEAFRTAAGLAPERASDALEMVGRCLIEHEDLDGATHAFQEALERADEHLRAVNLRYELGAVCERKGDFPNAVGWFESCAALEPEHRDVAARLFGLARATPAMDPPEPEEASPSALPAKRSKISYL